MYSKLKEIINLSVAKSPKKAVFVGIMLFNVAFMMLAGAIIAVLSKHISGLAECGYWEAVYRTITMVLDAGCIDNVIVDVGKAGAFAAIVCIVVVILGMIFFTGAVIGYITNIISDFIDSNNNGKNRLIISDHIVIINWNSRGAGIVNEFIYDRVKVVVMVPEGKDEIDAEIRNRLDTTLIKDNQKKEKMTFIVREGDVSSATDLDDICISKAKTVIILDSDSSDREKGNIQTVKTLIQVSEISKANSNQKIIVEVLDDWTEELVYRIIEFNNEDKQETIIPVLFNEVRGKAYAQLALNPDKGYIDVLEILSTEETYTGNKKSLVILGHSSTMDAFLKNIDRFKDDLYVVIFNDEEYLKEHNYFKEYPYIEAISADIFDEDTIRNKVSDMQAIAPEDVNVFIFSDDRVASEDIDAFALTYLIYIQENIRQKKQDDSNFDRDKIKVVVEIQNPKNEDIVKNYGADRVVFSNIYASRVIYQLSLKDNQALKEMLLHR